MAARVPAKCQEPEGLQRLSLLGTDWEQQFGTDLGLLPCGAIAQVHEVTVVAYVRGVQSAIFLCAQQAT